MFSLQRRLRKGLREASRLVQAAREVLVLEDSPACALIVVQPGLAAFITAAVIDNVFGCTVAVVSVIYGNITVDREQVTALHAYIWWASDCLSYETPASTCPLDTLSPLQDSGILSAMARLQSA